MGDPHTGRRLARGKKRGGRSWKRLREPTAPGFMSDELLVLFFLPGAIPLELPHPSARAGRPDEGRCPYDFFYLASGGSISPVTLYFYAWRTGWADGYLHSFWFYVGLFALFTIWILLMAHTWSFFRSQPPFDVVAQCVRTERIDRYDFSLTGERSDERTDAVTGRDTSLNLVDEHLRLVSLSAEGLTTVTERSEPNQTGIPFTSSI